MRGSLPFSALHLNDACGLFITLVDSLMHLCSEASLYNQALLMHCALLHQSSHKVNSPLNILLLVP